MNNFKRITITIFATIAVCVLTTASAQTFGSGSAIAATTNAPLGVGGILITNQATFPVPSKLIILSGISNTNETFIGSIYIQVPGVTNVGTLSNLVLIGSITNSFLTGTNNGTWMTNTPAGATTISFPAYMAVAIGANTNFIYVP